MGTVIPGESIWFHRYETDHYVQYNSICRVAPTTPHDDLNLSWFDEDGIETQANNVKNIEDGDLGATEDYWRRRYSSIDLSELNGQLETERVEKGGMVLFRPWDSDTHWAGGIFAVVLSTLGQPTDPHPVINIKYINASGEVITNSNLDCIEQFTDEDDAEGNDLWSNIPTILQGV